MQTVRQIERLWTGRNYSRLFRELLANRPEASLRLEIDSPGSTVSAALGIIRLDELNQSHVPLFSTFVRAVIAAQDNDGGWGDVTVTTLCLRALLIGKDTGGEAIARGFKYLSDLQKADGLWPKIPLRRMPGDQVVSAFVLYQLGDEPRFRSAVRFDDAISWFKSHQNNLDFEARKTWDRASRRWNDQPTQQPEFSWS